MNLETFVQLDLTEECEGNRFAEKALGNKVNLNQTELIATLKFKLNTTNFQLI